MVRGFLTAVLAVTLGLPAASPKPVTQFDWLIDASARMPIAAAELEQHLNQNFRTAIGGAEGFNAALAPLVPFTAGAVVSSSPTELRLAWTLGVAYGIRGSRG